MAELGNRILRPFAGREREFCLRIGEIGELERICGAGIGAIMLRLASHQFYSADIWETIRLGLEGGGLLEIEASALVTRYREQPLAPYLGLAAEIVQAAVSGADPEAAASGEETAEGHPATSPPSTAPAA